MTIAAAAAIAAPAPAGAQLQLTPPPREIPPAERAQPEAAPAPAPVQTQSPPAPTTQPAQSAARPQMPPPAPEPLRGATNPLPQDFEIAASPPPPPPPPPSPAPPPAPPPQQAAETTRSPPPPPPAPRVAPAPTATVTVGLQEDYTRIAFRFAGATTVVPLLQGNRLDLRFSRAADIDLAELRSSLPRFVRDIRRVSGAGQPLRLTVTLDTGVRQRHFVDGERVVVDLLPPEQQQPQAVTASGAPQQTEAQAPARPLVNGTARVQLVEEANVTRISVTWPAPTRAAAFRRGEAVWMLFDAAGRIDLSGVARAGRRHQDVEVVQGEGVIGLRVPAAPDIQVSASAREATWTFTLGARQETPQAAALERETTPDGRARLVANFGRNGVVRWVRDPEVGDRIGAAMIDAPVRGIDTRRATLEAAVLPAAQGAVIEPRADGVIAVFEAGDLVVTRGSGLLTATPAQAAARDIAAAQIEAALGDAGAETHASAPARPEDLVEVRERIDQLTRAAAMEGVREGAPVAARMALARYLIENEFAPEALGALRIVAINQGELVEIDPEYRLLRGAANVMMGRVSAALTDLNASALAENPSAALWRGYGGAAAELGRCAARARARRSAMEEHPPAWRARFQLALATAALELNDYAAAEAPRARRLVRPPISTSGSKRA
ncbi:MAG: hypothetical protein R3C16_08700 [Hyphomonadaceae bacterium]